MIEDDRTTVPSSRTSDGPAAPEGKERARQPIAERSRRDLAGREPVTSASFAEPVMQ